MENVPPPPGLGWATRGTKRTHSQMSGRRQAASRTARSPSTVSATDTSTLTHSTFSEDSADPNLQPQTSPHRPDVEPLAHIQLPSFRELDATRSGSANLAPENTSLGIAASLTARSTSAVMPTDVIDLTNDDDYVEYHQSQSRPPEVPSVFGRAQRGPRFHTEIIDLSGDTPHRPWQEQGRDGENDEAAAGDGQNSSPEVQFVGARPLSPRLRFAGVTPPAHHVPTRLDHTVRAAPIEIPDDDDVQIIEERRLPPQIPLPPPGRIGHFIETLGTATRILQDVGLIARGGISNRVPRRPHPYIHTRAHPHVHSNFETPNLDFGFAAFDLGYPQDDARTEREESVVQPPVAAPPGFTRNPTEDDVLVCPNCDAELNMGDGDDVKRQVWLVKSCGHIYCGECAASRAAPRQRKGKEPVNLKVKPLKTCVVDGCTSRTTGKQMIQLFL